MQGIDVLPPDSPRILQKGPSITLPPKPSQSSTNSHQRKPIMPPQQISPSCSTTSTGVTIKIDPEVNLSSFFPMIIKIKCKDWLILPNIIS